MTAPTDRNPALEVYRPLVEKAVAALGALVTHQVAYLAASLAGSETSSASDHGHLPLQWAVVAPLAVAAMAGFVLWQLRVLGFRSHISTGRLAGWVVAFFAIQESIEGAVGGHSLIEVATYPAVVTGLLIGPMVAWAMGRVLTGVTRLAELLLGRSTEPTPVASLPLVPRSVTARSAGALASSRPRAPPFVAS